MLEPLLDPTFSPSNYGFRPGRGAHDALHQASWYVLHCFNGPLLSTVSMTLIFVWFVCANHSNC